MRIEKSAGRCLAGLAAVAIAGTSAVAMQVVCDDPVTCDANYDGPFVYSPAQGSTGIVFVPNVPQQYPISIDKFDPNIAAAMHGVPATDILLKQVEVTLSMQCTSFMLHQENMHPTADCPYELLYLVDMQILDNGVAGPLSPPTLQFDVPVTIISAGDTLDMDLSDFPGNELPRRECLAQSAADQSLASWIGAGQQISWILEVLGVTSQVQCTVGSNEVTSQVRGDVSVEYVYCVRQNDPPPPIDCAEGCTPGYWKNHTERWDGVGSDDYTLTIKHQQSFNAVLGVDESLSGVPDSHTLHDAVSTGGGGIIALNRHTAAALPSSDTAIFYAYNVEQVVALYQDAVGAVAGPETITSVHSLFEDANEAGCPLGNNWVPSGYCAYCFADEGDCPCGADFLSGGCTNSTGQGGVLTPSGSTSHAADDLVLTASQLPPNVVVVHIMAPEATRTPLDDGNLCISPGVLKIIRFETQVSSNGGFAVLGPGIVQQSIDHPVDVAEILPGSTWHFQAYYRDRASTCGGDANLTNAVQVQFF